MGAIETEIVQALIENRKMSTSEQVSKYLAALDKLAQVSPNSLILSDLLKAFDDKTSHPEVMYSLVHLIDTFDLEYTIDILLQQTAELNTYASKWLQTLYIRLLNDDDDRSSFRNRYKLLAAKEKADVNRIFSVLIERDPTGLGVKVKEIQATD